MIDISFIIIIHWVADFCLQSRWMGNNKSHNWRALLSHTFTYSCCWILLWPILGSNVWWFMGITFIAHTTTDFFTSRLNAFLWRKRCFYLTTAPKLSNDYEHLYWVSHGFDQAVHLIQLIIVYNYL